MPTSSGFARGNGSVDLAAFWAFAEAHMIPARMIADMLRVSASVVKVPGMIRTGKASLAA